MSVRHCRTCKQEIPKDETMCLVCHPKPKIRTVTMEIAPFLENDQDTQTRELVTQIALLQDEVNYLRSRKEITESSKVFVTDAGGHTSVYRADSQENAAFWVNGGHSLYVRARFEGNTYFYVYHPDTWKFVETGVGEMVNVTLMGRE